MNAMQNDPPTVLPMPIAILVPRDREFDSGREEGVDVEVEVDVGEEGGRFIDVGWVFEAGSSEGCDVVIATDWPSDDVLELCVVCD